MPFQPARGLAHFDEFQQFGLPGFDPVLGNYT